MRSCLNCGHDQFTLIDRCKNCGAPLPKVSVTVTDETHPLRDTELRPLEPPTSEPSRLNPILFDTIHLLVFHMLASDARLVIKPMPSLSIGRRSSLSEYRPDLDLTRFGGWEQGVSRFHAMLICTPTLSLMDLRSANGTYLGTERLVPMTPYPLHAGDQIRFANLTLKLSVQAKETEWLTPV
jgi:pSer/pThr/pTyr-binding forkhead associated (FHA) protein